MPTLNLARTLEYIDDDPIDEPGCHVITEPCRGGPSRCCSLLVPIGTAEGKPLLHDIDPSRSSYTPTTRLRIYVFGPLGPGRYWARATDSDGVATRVVFEVANGRIETVKPVVTVPDGHLF